jgi:hypothetical protein
MKTVLLTENIKIREGFTNASWNKLIAADIHKYLKIKFR